MPFHSQDHYVEIHFITFYIFYLCHYFEPPFIFETGKKSQVKVQCAFSTERNRCMRNAEGKDAHSISYQTFDISGRMNDSSSSKMSTEN